jgi:hypothetical protein
VTILTFACECTAWRDIEVQVPRPDPDQSFTAWLADARAVVYLAHRARSPDCPYPVRYHVALSQLLDEPA